ncbi:MAG: 50S ribosomal protein L11 methyltransferase [Chitinophagia bacterium]|jgi:ribosomal protein L11 methyltransferase|nr:50S ribosomal protein L11 methyltransferase [Chitinophagia bacterium]
MSKEYIQIAFDFENQDQFEMLVAQLSAIGFEGFNEEEASQGINDGVKMSNKLGEGAGHCKTFILQTVFEANLLDNELNIIFNQFNIKYYKSIIKEKNWNAIWESNFEPVRVANFVGIRANFHPHFDPKVAIEIEITPKMSFGTGHHATTFTVIELMESINFKGKLVYDFGTGTGILAILAEKLGAESVLAVDNDNWCIENSIENIQNNDCHFISVEKVESAYQDKKFDIIIANVNRHIIEANMLELTQLAFPGSKLVLSGLLIEDQSDMIQLAINNGWDFEKSKPLNGWVSLLFQFH